MKITQESQQEPLELRPIRKYQAFVDRVSRAFPRDEVWQAFWFSSKNRFHLQNFENLDEQPLHAPPLFKNILRFSKQFLQCFLRVVLTRALHFGKKKRLKQRYHGKKITVLKTVIFNSSINDQSFKDPFFPGLKSFLKEKKNKAVLTIFDPSACFRKSLALRELPESCSFFLFLGFRDLLSCGFKIFSHLKMQPKAEMVGLPFERTKNLATFYRSELLDPNTIFSLLYHQAMKNLGEEFNIETYIYTFENNPWEKQGLLAFENYSPSTLTIGYQHSVMPLASVNMFLSQDEVQYTPTPHRILTLGNLNAELLKKWGGYFRTEIFSSSSLRYDYLFNLKSLLTKQRKTVLVALEGVYAVSSMVRFVLNVADKFPSYRFVIRAHPTLPLDKIDTGEYSYGDIPNVTFGDQNELLDDLRDCDRVLYWGSTVALEALKLGRPVLHYQIKSAFNFDPLFALKANKWIVWDEESLQNAFSQIDSLSEEDRQILNSTTQSFIETYISPISEEGLSLFCKDSQ